jgi:hypothetical protein
VRVLEDDPLREPQHARHGLLPVRVERGLQLAQLTRRQHQLHLRVPRPRAPRNVPPRNQSPPVRALLHAHQLRKRRLHLQRAPELAVRELRQNLPRLHVLCPHHKHLTVGQEHLPHSPAPQVPLQHRLGADQMRKRLRAAVTTVTRYDEWDTVLSYICFGLNTHMSQATDTSPFEFVHGFRARVPLEVGV